MHICDHDIYLYIQMNRCGSLTTKVTHLGNHTSAAHLHVQCLPVYPPQHLRTSDISSSHMHSS